MPSNSVTPPSSNQVYVACVPHVPFIAIQHRDHLPQFWAAYDQRVAEFKAFDPDLVIVFGADHYDGLHLKLMPSIVVGQIAEAMADTGGYPGTLNVPSDIALSCAEYLMAHDFDVATSYAMVVDHGFSNVIFNFLGALDNKPVLPIHINALCHPRPSFRRCRQLGEAVGQFANTLGKRVAFLGSGGLSHETSMIFPQFDTAPNEDIRDFIVHGGNKGRISHQQWLTEIHTAMLGLAGPVASGAHANPSINAEWDQQFLKIVGSGDLSAFDAWLDADVVKTAGSGAGEIRQWIAALAAAQVGGASTPSVDFYSSRSAIDVGAAIVHAQSNGRL
jgi:2,3-dihydroxyphenylpropionate 1,2-dioxygenase